VTSSLVWQSYLRGVAWSLYFFEAMYTLTACHACKSTISGGPLR